MTAATEQLAALTRKVDAFFARVVARHGDAMQCATGCADCCRVALTITRVEAEAIRELVAAWPAARRRALAEAPGAPSGAVAPGPRCAALDGDDRCRIYAARPLVCRSHGVPVRIRRAGAAAVESCHRNFRGVAPDPDCVLDQETLSATLWALDVTTRGAAGGAASGAGRARPASQAAASSDGGGAGGGDSARVELAALLAELAAI